MCILNVFLKGRFRVILNATLTCNSERQFTRGHRGRKHQPLRSRGGLGRKDRLVRSPEGKVGPEGRQKGRQGQKAGLGGRQKGRQDQKVGPEGRQKGR